VFSESIGTLFKAVVQHLIGTEIEEGAEHTFLGEKSPYSPYRLAQKSRVVPQKILGTLFKVLGRFSRHFSCWIFRTILAAFWAQISRQSVQH
jgi:hypothetical protein